MEMMSWIRLQAGMPVSCSAFSNMRCVMEDFLNCKIAPKYFKYLAAAFGGSLITSVYSLVDMAMVGQYEGLNGTAALAVVAPLWNIIYSLGLLTGIGGSVLFSTLRGRSAQNRKASNGFFTAALIETFILAAICWILLLFFDRPLLTFFGADETLLMLAERYLTAVKFVVPCFMFNQMLSAFLRNDGAPGLATWSVLAGGIFNIFGDYFFVFALDMGVLGAGIATAAGSVISLLIMLTHFISKKNTIRLEISSGTFKKILRISTTGFSSFFIDVAMGILTVLFNRQIMKYLGTNALSVYGVIINISTFVQCCAYSIGHAAQPMISANFGAGKKERIFQILKYALGTSAFFGILWTVMSETPPNLFVHIFMSPSADVLEIAPAIIRCYAVSFLLLPFNIFSTYFFQALLKNKISFVISVSRGAVISGILIMVLPAAAGVNSIWFAMPISELLVAVYVIVMMVKSVKSKN